MSKKTNKPSRILEAVYETACDLHACGALNDEQMKQYEEIAQPVAVYLDKDVFEYLNKKAKFNSENLQILINELLRKDIEIAQRVAL